ncbi:IMPACT [Bugula neritina]|uniref:IMPACT n=1 Tax=Bugula neritina TaxID=10212 RepID=A0A7J7JUM5_BUGNE|nr:IMPACT [Bugula neritina]
MVTTTSQVSLVMRTLLSNKKISAATHNIQAYRIRLGNDSICEDCDDDGEAQAGSRVLHLLNIVGAVNVLVVVSRWYGGILLGPDRFKHINNCARNILEKHNIIQHNKESVKKGTRHKKN